MEFFFILLGTSFLSFLIGILVATGYEEGSSKPHPNSNIFINLKLDAGAESIYRHRVIDIDHSAYGYNDYNAIASKAQKMLAIKAYTSQEIIDEREKE